MDGRAAKRVATRQLASAARRYAEQVPTITVADGLTKADGRRLVKAFDELAHELDTRCGDAARGPRPVVDNPDQHFLFDVNRE